MSEEDHTGKKSKNVHVPLADQIADDGKIRVRNRKKNERRAKRADVAGPDFVESRLSRNILDQAREQQDDEEGRNRKVSSKPSARQQRISATKLDSDDEGEFGTEEDVDREQQSYYESLQIDQEDEEALQKFMAPRPEKRLTLGDIIMAKIREKQTEIASQMSEQQPTFQLSPEIVEVYQDIGKILSHYRSGKLPKAFKIIPNLENWEEIVYLTEPDNWTAAAMYQATRIFTSNLNTKMAQRFYNLILMPRIRDDIVEYKRLNFQLFMALKKSIFKTAAFFKGILLPICEAGDCTLREAVIISSVLSRTSIPVMHASAAMLKIAEMPYTGANSIFLRVMLDKKYSLPYRVIDALVFHFTRFHNDTRYLEGHDKLPVLWHQCLLTFVERYKEDITSEQKDAIRETIRQHCHPKITPDIRREIDESRSRNNKAVKMNFQ